MELKAHKNRRVEFFSIAGIFALASGMGVADLALNDQNPLQNLYSDVTAPASTVSNENQTLLKLAQKQATMLFWECGHPVSGMIGDRIPVAQPSDGVCGGNVNVVTGATGFGIMALIGAVKEGWLDRTQVRDRIEKIVEFLGRAETWHGMFPHMMNGETGRIVPFAGPEDKGGDSFETAAIEAALIIAREFFSGAHPDEWALRSRINKILEDTDWNWYVREQYGAPRLFWILSPDSLKRLQDRPLEMQPHVGAAEGVLALLMASMAPRPISPEVYRQVADNAPDFVNGEVLYGHEIPTGPRNGGGPLFPGAYLTAFIGPEGIKGPKVDFSKQWQNQVLVFDAYRRRKNYPPIGTFISAGDGPDGYQVRSISLNENGTFSADMAMAYSGVVPDVAIAALQDLYNRKDPAVWGKFGPTSSVNLDRLTDSSGKKGFAATDYLSMDHLAAAAVMSDVSAYFLKSPEFQKLSPLGLESPHLLPREDVVADAKSPKP